MQVRKSKKIQAKVPVQNLVKPSVKAAVAVPMVKANNGGSGGGITPVPPIKGLSFPKTNGSTSDLIEKRLKNKSPWYQSITDPLHGADCKIPDETGVETGTLQLVQTGLVQANAQGLAGISVHCPYPNSAGAAGAATNYATLNAAATLASMTYNNGLPFDTQSALASYAKCVRVVSACCIMVPESALANNAGELLGFSEPFTSYAPTTYDEYSNNYKTAIVPINNNRPVCTRWYPATVQHMDFKQFFIPTNAFLGVEDNRTPNWTFGVLAYGPPAIFSGVNLRWRIIVNYEFIPQYNAINILDARPSPTDAQETDLVENWVQSMEPSSMAVTKQVTSPPSSVSPSHDDEETGFGMAFHVLGELLPFALALL